MEVTGIISFLIIFITCLVSYRGFTDTRFFDKYSFEIDRILISRDYKRLVTSGFLHVSWLHLIFNMVSLYLFSGGIENYLGPAVFLLIYFVSLIGGNLFALLIHRSHGSYSSVGASGAICGVMFASIAIFPGMRIGFFFLPLAIPAWIYGLTFILYSIYGIRSKKDNIGHEAHLGGAVVGMIIALLFHPAAITENILPIAIIIVPSLIFIWLIIKNPAILFIDNYWFKHQYNYTVDDRYNVQKRNTQQEVDRILDKINQKGINSLSKKERDMLEEYSKK